MTTIAPARRSESLELDEPPPRRGRPAVSWRFLPLTAILLVQVCLAVRPGMVQSPFEDEGLYIYMGHRMWDHLLHGAFLSEYPGAFFSGAPGLYPPLAALGDQIGGLNGARNVSLTFALGATVGVYGIGRGLFSRTAGLLGAGAFVLQGSVIYQSHLATFDSMTLCLIALAAHLTVHSVRRNAFLWAPVVAGLLVVAFFAKYAGAAYIPVTAALAIATSIRCGSVLIVARRTIFMVAATAALGYSFYALWGQSLRRGISVTTTARHIIHPSPAWDLLESVQRWAGPWLLAAVIGAVVVIIRDRRSWVLALVLLGGSIIAVVQQVRIGESTSLAKHVAFGMVYASPLIGSLFAEIPRTRILRIVGLVVVTGAYALFAVSGLNYSRQFLTGWIPNTALIGPLGRLVTATAGRPILGDAPSPDRYYLRSRVEPALWNDTYDFHYDRKVGWPAYKAAIDQTSFGVIYLTKQPYPGNPTGSPTDNSLAVWKYLQTDRTAYRLAGTVDRYRQGVMVGKWYLFFPKVATLPVDWAATTGLSYTSSVWTARGPGPLERVSVSAPTVPSRTSVSNRPGGQPTPQGQPRLTARDPSAPASVTPVPPAPTVPIFPSGP